MLLSQIAATGPTRGVSRDPFPRWLHKLALCSDPLRFIQRSHYSNSREKKGRALNVRPISQTQPLAHNKSQQVIYARGQKDRTIVEEGNVQEPWLTTSKSVNLVHPC